MAKLKRIVTLVQIMNYLPCSKLNCTVWDRVIKTCSCDQCEERNRGSFVSAHAFINIIKQVVEKGSCQAFYHISQ